MCPCNVDLTNNRGREGLTESKRHKEVVCCCYVRHHLVLKEYESCIQKQRDLLCSLENISPLTQEASFHTGLLSLFWSRALTSFHCETSRWRFCETAQRVPLLLPLSGTNMVCNASQGWNTLYSCFKLVEQCSPVAVEVVIVRKVKKKHIELRCHQDAIDSGQGLSTESNGVTTETRPQGHRNLKSITHKSLNIKMILKTPELAWESSNSKCFSSLKLTDDSCLYILVVQCKQEPLKANSALKNLQSRGTAGASHVADDGNIDGLNAFIITRFSLNPVKTEQMFGENFWVSVCSVKPSQHTTVRNTLDMLHLPAIESPLQEFSPRCDGSGTIVFV